ncbi:MAG: DegV family protein [Butyricicoccus sp.]
MQDKIAIITDSCADLRPECIEGKPIFVIPFILNFSDGIYYDGVTIQPDEVYRRLPQEMPKTSLPSGEEFNEVMDRVHAAGYNKAVAILLSSGLSGSFQMLRLMAQEREDLEIFAYDSLTGSLGEAAIVLTLCRLIEEGRSWEEIKEITPRVCNNTTVFFSVDTLEYLKKGGRIGKITAMAGTALNIKPILSFAENGQLESVAKVRGRAAAMKKVVELAVSCIQPGKRYNIMWAHGGCPEEGRKVAGMLREAAPDFVEEFWGVIDCTLGSYTGPKLLGAAVQVLDDDM